jgi:hypothetical protein
MKKTINCSQVGDVNINRVISNETGGFPFTFLVQQDKAGQREGAAKAE